MGQCHILWALGFADQFARCGFGCFPVLHLNPVLNHFFLTGKAVSAILLISLLEILESPRNVMLLLECQRFFKRLLCFFVSRAVALFLSE